MRFYGVTVYDHDGTIVTIEPAMLVGRDIGAREEAAIRAAIQQLSGFIGCAATNHPDEICAVDRHGVSNTGTPTPRDEKRSLI